MAGQTEAKWQTLFQVLISLCSSPIPVWVIRILELVPVDADVNDGVDAIAARFDTRFAHGFSRDCDALESIVATPANARQSGSEEDPLFLVFRAR